jgi:gas vesicle protein
MGVESVWPSAEKFMDANPPYADTGVRSTGTGNGWSKYSKNSIQRVCRGMESAYGGWRFRYLAKDDPMARLIREEEIAERRNQAVPESVAAEMDAHRQRRTDDANLMSGDLTNDEVKAVLRRKYNEIVVFLSRIRNGEWMPPKGWSAKEEVSFLREVAEVHGIDWSSIADTRTDADKMRDSIDKIVREGVSAAMELTDDELEVLERSMADAVEGCKAYIRQKTKDDDTCPDHVKERFHPDGSWKKGESFSEDDQGDADEMLARELAEFEQGSVYLDVEDELVGEALGEEAFDESQDEPDDTDNGGDSGGAGVDGTPGGASRPPAPESDDEFLL